MPQPNKIPLAFAASGDKNTIPESTETTGLASWRDGFPMITSTPFSEGGIAPKRADFNGIFNALSLATLWQQQGGFYAYDATTDYEVGNVVEYNGDLYKCLSANGPSSAVKAPTDATVWSKVMTAADTAAAYLPLSGGNLTGNLGLPGELSFTGSSPVVNAGGADHYLRLGNGNASSLYTNGASMYLYGANATANHGGFVLNAFNGTLRSQLAGSSDGTLTWNGKDVAMYETGTWTPTLYGGSTAGTITNTSNYSYYIKINDLVYVRFYFSWKITTAPTGEVRMSGLPYIPDTYYHGLAGCNTHICNYVNAVQNNSYARVSSYTPTTSVGITCNWGTGSNTYNNWNNAVNATDSLLGWLLYRTSA